jgi:hypothetical protein
VVTKLSKYFVQFHSTLERCIWLEHGSFAKQPFLSHSHPQKILSDLTIPGYVFSSFFPPELNINVYTCIFSWSSNILSALCLYNVYFKKCVACSHCFISETLGGIVGLLIEGRQINFRPSFPHARPLPTAKPASLVRLLGMLGLHKHICCNKCALGLYGMQNREECICKTCLHQNRVHFSILVS